MRFLSRIAGYIRCNFLTLLLAFLWMSGLFVGVVFANLCEAQLSSLVYLAASQPLSLAVHLIFVLLPFILCFTAIHFRAFYFVYPVSAFRAFLLGYCLAGVRVAFGDAAWLARLLFLFTDFFSSQVYLWFLCRCISQGKRCSSKDCFIAFSVLIIVAFF